MAFLSVICEGACMLCTDECVLTNSDLSVCAGSPGRLHEQFVVQVLGRKNVLSASLLMRGAVNVCPFAHTS